MLRAFLAYLCHMKFTISPICWSKQQALSSAHVFVAFLQVYLKFLLIFESMLEFTTWTFVILKFQRWAEIMVNFGISSEKFTRTSRSNKHIPRVNINLWRLHFVPFFIAVKMLPRQLKLWNTDVKKSCANKK